MTGLGSNLGFSSGLFDFGPTHAAQATSNVKDVEICRLREELGAARAKLHSWEESMGQARTACDAWKKEAAIANKKAEMAIKEREVALNKAVQLQKELEQLSCCPQDPRLDPEEGHPGDREGYAGAERAALVDT